MSQSLRVKILPFIIRRRGDLAKYDIDQAKIFLHIRRGLRHKIVMTKQFDWTSFNFLGEFIGQSVAPDSHAHLRMFEKHLTLRRMFEKQVWNV